jgi:serine/threonine protein kinase
MTRDILPHVNNRYQLIDLLGEGGMGAVYRALDRLTGETVALKHVAVSPGQLQFASRTDQDPALALAQEFEVLASLRHPHIIAVRDYGFDADHRPYFTMDLLENATTIIEAGHDRLVEFKINLIQQMLLALMYLHRRGIVHRDLKPGNALVKGGMVKVLDFGLSVAVDKAEAAPVRWPSWRQRCWKVNPRAWPQTCMPWASSPTSCWPGSIRLTSTMSAS